MNSSISRWPIIALIMTLGMMGATRSWAKCECACVNGAVRPLCTRAIELPPICPSRVCPIVPPAVAPIAPLRLPPLGTEHCWMAQVYNPAIGRYKFQQVCR